MPNRPWHGTARNSSGDAVTLPTVTVYLAGTSTLASIFDSVGGAKLNPFTGAADGTFAFYVDDATKVEVLVEAAGFTSRTLSDLPVAITEHADLTGLTTGDPHTQYELERVVNVVRYGATGNGTTDDTTACQNALAAALASKSGLYFPTGTYLLAGAGTEILKVTTAIEVFGDGKYSVLKFAAGVPATRDMVLFEPATTADARFFRIRDLQIATTSAAGRYGVHLRPAASSISVSRFTIERLWSQSLADFGIYMDGNLATASGVSAGVIRDCWMSGDCIGGVDVLDSMVIDNNVLAGSGYGVDITFGAGPGRFRLRDNNITATGGARFQGNMAGFLADGNYFETIGTYSGANAAMLDLDGTGGTLNMPVVRDNQFTVLSGLAADGLRLNNTVQALVDGNFFSLAEATRAGIVITANAVRTRITPSNRHSTTGTPVKDGSGNDISDRRGNVLDVWTGAATTAGTAGEETVYTLTLDANTFDEVGRSVRMTFSGVGAANANSKVIRSKLNLTTLHGWTLTTSGASWSATVTITKTGANAQRSTGVRTIGGSSDAVTIANTTETDTGALALSVTFQTATAAGDATLNHVLVELLN